MIPSSQARSRALAARRSGGFARRPLFDKYTNGQRRWRDRLNEPTGDAPAGIVASNEPIRALRGWRARRAERTHADAIDARLAQTKPIPPTGEARKCETNPPRPR